MSDAAAFFAKKKNKKKKSYKFNANKIDASQVTSTVHVDAPSISSGINNDISSLTINSGKEDEAAAGDWDDSALASKFTVNTAATTTSTGGAAELMDMKALEKKRNEQDDIKERLRVEETKQKLAAAREGMEKEAQRLKEEKNAKEEAKKSGVNATPSTGNRFGAAAANMGAGAGGGATKWVPSRVSRAPVASSGPGSRFQRKVDTQDEELFPDLATADKIIEQEEERKQQAQKQAKGPVWGAKKATPAPRKEEKPEPPAPVKEPEPAPAPVEAEKKEEIKPTPKAPVGAGLKKKKKKKKDLSTFKA
jgi:hypothetical protein